jgi:hypothetical protein
MDTPPTAWYPVYLAGGPSGRAAATVLESKVTVRSSVDLTFKNVLTGPFLSAADNQWIHVIRYAGAFYMQKYIDGAYAGDYGNASTAFPVGTVQTWSIQWRASDKFYRFLADGVAVLDWRSAAAPVNPTRGGIVQQSTDPSGVTYESFTYSDPTATAAAAAPLVRPDRCVSLLKRTEFRSGCAGLTCRHGCKLDLPAVPAGHCQTCTAYVAEPGEPWIAAGGSS